MPWTNDTGDTDRLILRPAASRDSDVVFRFLTDPEVRRYLGGPMPDKDARDALAKASLGEQWGSFLIVHYALHRSTGATVTPSRHCEQR